MTDPSIPGGRQAEPPDLSAIMSEIVSFVPPAEEIEAIRGYLRDITAAVQLLPELDPTADPLDVGFDPAWREGRA